MCYYTQSIQNNFFKENDYMYLIAGFVFFQRWNHWSLSTFGQHHGPNREHADWTERNHHNGLERWPNPRRDRVHMLGPLHAPVVHRTCSSQWIVLQNRRRLQGSWYRRVFHHRLCHLHRSEIGELSSNAELQNFITLSSSSSLKLSKLWSTLVYKKNIWGWHNISYWE